LITHSDDGPDFEPDDPLAIIMRPASDYLGPPPGRYEEIRRGAARRRLLRTVVGVGAVCAVAALVALPVRLATPDRPTSPTVPLAPPPASSPPASPTPPPSPEPTQSRVTEAPSGANPSTPAGSPPVSDPSLPPSTSTTATAPTEQPVPGPLEPSEAGNTTNGATPGSE